MPAPTAAPTAVIVLAAGEGTRMKSRTRPKVLHGFAGRSLLGHVLAAAAPLGATQTVVVVGHQRDAVVAHLGELGSPAEPVVQDEQHGTGHAVRIALQAVPAEVGGAVLVLPGDAPLLTATTLRELLTEHAASGAAVTILSSVVADPTGYGRLLRDASGAVTGIVEHQDASEQQLAITEIGTSVYVFDHALLRAAITRLSTDNAQGEQYLPDAVGILAGDGHRISAVVAPAQETAGVNDRIQLAAAHRLYNARLLHEHMRDGVTVVDPLTTWVDADVTLAPDVTLWPSVDLHGATHIGEGAEIGPHVTLTDTTVGARSRIDRCVGKQATIGADVTIGPFAYLRPGTALADGVHIGTYVELKKADVGAGTKIPHLSYVGDATIGEQTNIGAATVFVNYDGVDKHHTVIGSHARTGADNMFVAPVEVGDGAYTAAGSVITHDVPPGAMGVARAAQRNVARWVLRKRSGTAAAEAAARALGNDEDEG
ncbi:MAG TPA: bifunctional UDP-N-acetylglucosamine diphosphorylase/glucosamine-1-phosphate N-acetyltransferase GlmU [Jatrophihabitantaceae bacterium]|nr:bifunctional UDP-N-acetylglucosamine diphosphorylase/glucosamine-1-phosphate N-acetyltransferase GlmU [Jatrophihabitantaceae bacterium]